MSFGDELEEHFGSDQRTPRARGAAPYSSDVLSPSERELLAKSAWTIDELVAIAFIARRLAARLEVQRLRSANKQRAYRDRERSKRAGPRASKTTKAVDGAAREEDDK